MRRAKTLQAAICCFAFAVAAIGCASNATGETDPAEISVDINMDAMDFGYSDRDLDASYNASKATHLNLKGNSIEIDGKGATAEGTIVTISQEGTYVVEGSLDAGQIIVEADNDHEIQIVLNNANITNENASALHIKQAGKTYITLASESKNVLSDGNATAISEDSDETFATLLSEEDLTINGEGQLTVNGARQHAVLSDHDLVITGGSLNVTSTQDALRGKDCVKIADGVFTVNAGEDAIKAKNDEDGTLGFVSIDGGTFTISAGDDAIHGESVLQVNAGTIEITTCEEGLEAERVFVNGGEVNVTSNDDAINASARETANGTLQEDQMGGAQGAPEAQEGAGKPIDRQQPEGDPAAGTFDPGANDQTPPEPPANDMGQEGKPADGQTPPEKPVDGQTPPEPPTDGQTPLDTTADNQPQNAGGMMLMAGANESCIIQINDGVVTINALGDALDSNGYLEINGGTVFINGSSENSESCIDYEYGSSISGGTLLAAGPAGMGGSFGSDSTQAFISARVQGSADSLVQVKDDSGAVLAEITSVRNFQSVIASSPKMKAGETYTLSINGSDAQVTAS